MIRNFVKKIKFIKHKPKPVRRVQPHEMAEAEEAEEAKEKDYTKIRVKRKKSAWGNPTINME